MIPTSVIRAMESSSVDPEVLDAFEVGLKSEFADRRVQLNAAAYYYDYKNIQAQRVVFGAAGQSFATLQNAAAATLYGLDADIAIVPTRGLRLNVGFNLEHSKYDDFGNASGYNIVNGFPVTAAFDLTGKKVLGAPTFSYTLGGSYTLDLAQTGSVLFNANFGHSSRYAFGAGEGQFVRPTGILNGSITFTDASDRYSLEVWGRNLTDERVLGQYTSTLFTSAIIRSPRSYGVTGAVKF